MGLPEFVKLQTGSDFAWIFVAMIFTVALFFLLCMRFKNAVDRWYLNVPSHKKHHHHEHKHRHNKSE
jgi:bacteriorhodopsin